jgi:hypothetical protein
MLKPSSRPGSSAAAGSSDKSGFGLAGEQATKTKTAHRVFSHSLHAGATA